MNYPHRMENGIRPIWPCGLNTNFGSKFQQGYCVWQQSPEEGQRIQWPKCCEYNNNEDPASLKSKAYNNNIF